MLSILTGAKKNIGDFLIGDRAKKLLKTYVDENILEIDRFGDIEPFLEQINQSKALILCGGPAYTSDFYPSIYNLEGFIDKIKVPIIPFGLGWSGSPFHAPSDFKFSEKSTAFLKEIHEKIEFSSCRDVITERILHQNGINKVLMTGCPVWYHLPAIDQSYDDLKKVDKLVFSTGAKQILWWQSIKLLKNINQVFPNSEIIVSYHRGIFPGKNTPLRKGISYVIVAAYAKIKGFKVVDVSGDLEKIAFYENCDLHIGYRVHAHLDFLSRRKPSYLINEDGRGLGMVESLSLPIFNYDDQDLLAKLTKQLKEDKSTHFVSFIGTFKIMKASFTKMKTFLKYLNSLND